MYCFQFNFFQLSAAFLTELKMKNITLKELDDYCSSFALSTGYESALWLLALILNGERTINEVVRNIKENKKD